MERESFENDSIAALMNRHFVCIKVDREERPDVDRIYMTFVQATTGGGGWPMSVWLTPDLKPFYRRYLFSAGASAMVIRAFPMVLERIAEAWQQDRDKIIESSREVIAQLQKQSTVRLPAPGSMLRLDPAALDSGFFQFRRTFDSRYGGFGDAPKFPRPGRPEFPAALLRPHRQPRSARHGARHLARNGPGRHERSTRRRFPSLFGGRALVRPALREDALRPGAARDFLPGSVSDYAAKRSTRRQRAASSITCCAT